MNDDSISRNTLLRYIADWQYSEAIVGNETVYDTIEKFYHMVEEMPSAQPYTEKEIQAMQDLEQAQLDKAYQIGVEEGLQSTQPESRREWYMHGYRDAQPRWIPCEERLPEEQDEYLVTWVTKLHTGEWFVGTEIFEYDLSEDNWLFDDYMNAYLDVTVTAWMPVPEPYKGE